MVLAYLILTICFTAYLIFWGWTNRKDLLLSWRMPGLFPFIPFVGVALRFFLKENMDAIDSLLEPYDNSDTPVGIWLGAKFLIYIDNPRDIETVLTSPNCVRDNIYQYIKDVMGFNGIFTSDGEIWRKHRRLVSPSFSEKVAMSYVPTFDRRTRDLIANLKSMVNKEPFDIRLPIVNSALDAFFEATFSTNIEPESRLKFHRYVKIGQSIIGKRFFSPWYRSNWLWKLSGFEKLSQKIARVCNDGMDRVMETVIKTGSSELTFLERLIRVSEENEDFSMEDVKAEALTALTAGSDTSTWSIAFTVLLLAMYPEHQERVFEEIKALLPSKDTPIRPEHIKKMPYLEMCIKESLRLFPVVCIMSKTVKHGPIYLGGYEVHPGVSIIIGINRVQRKLKYWGQDADKFNPSRFSPDNISNINRFSFIPFSEGPRNCVGYKYAHVAMKSILAGIFRNYRVTTPLKLDELKIRMKVNILLINKHMVQIYDRNE